MSRSKQRGHSEVEHLRGLIRSLKSENRHLRKQLRQYENREPVEDVDDIQEITLNVCPKCRTGIMTESDYKFVIVRKCGTCEHTERTKKVQP